MVLSFSLSLLLLACGGSDSVSDPYQPADTTAPTVTITNDVTTATATRLVTFTLTFSEAIADPIIDTMVNIEGGTPASVIGGSSVGLIRVSPTVSTVGIVPPPDATGTMTISIAPGAFNDLTGNPNTETYTASVPFDTLAPSVVITDDISGATTTGDVTFTFTFSEPVEESFNASKITVEGGTAGTFTRVSSTVSTLVVSHSSDTSGVITVSVAAGSFMDLNGISNTATASASQGFAPDGPTIASPIPSDSAAGVIALLCGHGTYTPISVGTWRSQWSKANCTVSDYASGGITVKKFTMAGTDDGNYYVIIENFEADITDKTTLHLDYFTNDGSTLAIKVVDWGDDNAYSGSDNPGTGVYNADTETKVSVTPITLGSWQSAELDFSAQATKKTVSSTSHIRQIVVQSTTPETWFIDNLYFKH